MPDRECDQGWQRGEELRVPPSVSLVVLVAVVVVAVLVRVLAAAPVVVIVVVIVVVAVAGLIDGMINPIVRRWCWVVQYSESQLHQTALQE